jgi:forkhead box protein N
VIANDLLKAPSKLINSEVGKTFIYDFNFSEHFPYFKTAPSGWKNSVRHNLSLNKSFEKIEKPNPTGSQRKGCLWTMNPAKITKMDDEVAKWAKKDLIGIKRGMINPGK